MRALRASASRRLGNGLRSSSHRTCARFWTTPNAPHSQRRSVPVRPEAAWSFPATTADRRGTGAGTAWGLRRTPRDQTPPFWVLARALRDFVADPGEGDGLLPLLGSIPDMESDTESYVQLQTMCVPSQPTSTPLTPVRVPWPDDVGTAPVAALAAGPCRYRDRAKRDTDAVIARVRSLLTSIERRTKASSSRCAPPHCVGIVIDRS